MVRKRPISPLGWAIKKRLAELQMDQREFCQRYHIPENRLGDIMTNARKATKYRNRIVEILNLERNRDS
ncbi:XRE family transcriptional regulator [Brevibacillus fluminis]|uniref:XRE family transcriptional regulator n=1 Tax=Brevibacillus fluminis TaxID=511487 RepID=A0A3M8DYR3_9BACL|nr:XRE family transcriptional regulator [Brevibacillus fluminis]RNB92669.1 XRE family transcriptional regulator [Brevibacillus fluminis]